MKHIIFFKNIVTITLFCTTHIDAKMAGGAGAAPARRPEPIQQPKAATPTPVAKQPTPQPQQKPVAHAPTFHGLIAYVKNTPSVWDRTNAQLNTNFVNDMIQKARVAQLDALQLETILQTARDVHGIFSGNQQKDIAILQSVDNQIASAIK